MDLEATLDRDGVRRLRWAGLDHGGAAYHAALFVVEPATPYQIRAHRHDFFEMLYILDGTGDHGLAPANEPPRRDRLEAGDLIFLRPDDCHSLSVPAGGRLHWINIAFPAESWRSFRAAADLDSEGWDAAPLPRIARLAALERRVACAAYFEEALRQFQGYRALGSPPPDRLDLCRFLADASRLLRAEAEDASMAGPPWLRRACLAMEREPESAAAGVERFVALAGVSYAHLSRTLKAATGKTPTQYVNDLRLARAALRLTTTPLSIVEIAGECGFNQLSYFYRLFRERFGTSPDAYRRAARAALAP